MGWLRGGGGGGGVEAAKVEDYRSKRLIAKVEVLVWVPSVRCNQEVMENTKGKREKHMCADGLYTSRL